MTDALPIEYERAIERFERQQDRVSKDMGEGDTVAGLAIAQAFLPKLTQAFHKVLGKPLGYRYQSLRPLLITLPDEVIALCCLQHMFHFVAQAQRVAIRELYSDLGQAIAGELWAAEFREWSDRKDAKAKKKGVEKPRVAARVAKAAKRKHGSHAYRMQAGRSLASRAGFTPEVRIARLLCGEFCVGVVKNALPDVFQLDQNPFEKHEYTLTLTDQALGVADRAIGEAITRNPSFVPITTPPKPWTCVYDGGTWDERVSTEFVRRGLPETCKAVDVAMRSGAAAPLVEAVNALQAVPWAINARVLGIMHECVRLGVSVPGLISGPLVEALPEVDEAKLTKRALKARRIRAGQLKVANLRLKSGVCLQAEDLHTADELAKHERFWTPMNIDWRGRIYGMPSFNYQRDDRIRGLFLFADGEPIGEAGLYWLKWHVANVGDFQKISKQPFEERVRWTEQHLDQIEQMSWTPLEASSLQWWTTADKPFLFLAACLELASAMKTGPSYVTRLPIASDGSCSGLQHLCAMTRAPEGSLVNLTPSPKPQDVYQIVADRVHARVASEIASTTATPASLEIAKQCLAFGITRKLCKRNVMTYSYSSKKYGMGHQHIEDTMRPLSYQVLTGQLKNHPFGQDEGRAAAKYLAAHIYDAIEEIVNLPAQAMTFLQKVAKVLAHEGKPVRYTTPAGLPIANRYHDSDCKAVTLWMHDRGVILRSTTKLACGFKKEIDKYKAANAIAPNVVHSLDASHLVYVVRAAVQAGVHGLATVHDSFACLAPRAGAFRKIIREQLVALYQQHDPLAGILKQAEEDLSPEGRAKLPPLPLKGSLDIREVLNAEYAFA